MPWYRVARLILAVIWLELSECCSCIRQSAPQQLMRKGHHKEEHTNAST
jgi:hypothetical protein